MHSKLGIKDIFFEDCCVSLLKQHSVKLDAAGAAKKLLAWTPLIKLAGETNPIHAAYSIAMDDWSELAASFATVNKIVYAILVTDCKLHAANHDFNPKLKTFWQAMGIFYESQMNL